MFIINQQLAILEKWSNDAQQVGNFVADEVIDRLQRELNEATEEGVVWDFMDSIKGILLGETMIAFDDACEKWITQRFDKLVELAKTELGDDWEFDTSSASLANLQKSFRIRQNLESLFDKMFAKSKPSVFTLLARVIKDELSDSIDHMDAEMEQDAARLQANFNTIRQAVADEISSTASVMFLRVIHQYRDALMHVKAA